MRVKWRNVSYIMGELNRLIDSVLHSLIEDNPQLTMVDAILHAVVEQNPTESTLKFVKYNLAKIIKKKKKAKFEASFSITTMTGLRSNLIF